MNALREAEPCLGGSGAPPFIPNGMFERHFSPRTLAELWGFSEDTIQRWFEDEPGVLKCGSEGGRGKPRRVSLRIPEAVAARVYHARTQARVN
jgi:hypothetical protein